MNVKRFLSLCALSMTLLFSGGLFAADPVNLNTAGAKDIAKALSGIGAKKAQAIIEFRQANGPFQSIDDLALVKGIGKGTVNKNRHMMVVNDLPVSESKE